MEQDVTGNTLHSGDTHSVPPVQRVLRAPLEQSQTHESQFTVFFSVFLLFFRSHGAFADLNVARIMAVPTMQEHSLQHFCNGEFPSVGGTSLISVVRYSKCFL